MARENLARLKKKVKRTPRCSFTRTRQAFRWSVISATLAARRGERPVIETSTEITRRLYLASAISVAGDLAYCLREKPFDAVAIIEFLKQLLATFSGKLLIIWDNASIHDCQAIREFLQTDERAKRLHLAKQPTYSPEVNADEQVWSQIKCGGLKNQCYRNVKELQPKLIQEMEKLKNKPELIKQFFHHEDVSFYN